MKTNNYKLFGVVGGVGPEASNKFCELLVKYKSAKNDQDNIPFIHFCNPQIPDRTESILGRGENPVDEIVKTCKTLENVGAEFLVIPCNTAHYFYSDIQERVTVPIVNMIGLLVKKIKSDNPGIRRVGVLATTGSIKSGIFEDTLGSLGIETVIPYESEQKEIVMEAIYGKNGIKAGKKHEAKKLLTLMAKRLVERGAEAVILGCTEVPLVLDQKDFATKLYDPMDISAHAIIKFVESGKRIKTKSEVLGVVG